MTPQKPHTHLPAWAYVVYAKDQPEYLPLPAYVSPTGIVHTEWTPTATEVDELRAGGRIRILLHTFNRPLQPIQVNVIAPEGRNQKES